MAASRTPETVTAAQMPIPARLSPDGMTASHALVYVTVVDQKTGAVLRTPGPYLSAAAARTACGTTAGQVLVWTRQELDWVAELDGTEYRVPADPALDA